MILWRRYFHSLNVVALKGLFFAFLTFGPCCRCRPSYSESRSRRRCSACYSRPSVKLRGARRNRWWAARFPVSPALFVLASCARLSNHSLLLLKTTLKKLVCLFCSVTVGRTHIQLIDKFFTQKHWGIYIKYNFILYLFCWLLSLFLMQ